MPDAVEKALSLLGTKYVWGGNCPDGVDCSGLAKYAYPSLPRLGRDQFKSTQRVTSPQRGDLVFLKDTAPGKTPKGLASHVGIYDGTGNVIEASSVAGKVIKSPLSKWQGKNFLGFGRVSGPYSYNPPSSSSQTTFRMPTLQANLDPVVLELLRRRQALDALHPHDYANESSPELARSLGIGPYQTVQMPLQGPGIQQPTDQYPTPNQLVAKARSQVAQTYNPFAAQGIEAAGQLASSEAQLGYLNNRPLEQAQFTPYVAPQFNNQRNFPDFPNRPAPRSDTTSSVLGALAGFIDPSGAGQYNAAPIQASIGQANQEFQDRQLQYQDALQRSNLGYEDALRQYQTQLGIGQYNNQGLNTTAANNAQLVNQRNLQVAGITGNIAGAKASTQAVGEATNLARQGAGYQAVADQAADYLKSKEKLGLEYDKLGVRKDEAENRLVMAMQNAAIKSQQTNSMDAYRQGMLDVHQTANVIKQNQLNESIRVHTAAIARDKARTAILDKRAAAYVRMARGFANDPELKLAIMEMQGAQTRFNGAFADYGQRNADQYQWKSTPESVNAASDTKERALYEYNQKLDRVQSLLNKLQAPSGLQNGGSNNPPGKSKSNSGTKHYDLRTGQYK